MIRPYRFLGVYLNTYSVQSEGLTTVFDNLESVGCNSVVIVPAVSEPVDEGGGTRIPVLHVDGYRRRLARPVFGRQELHMKTYRVCPPAAELFRNTRYRPRHQDIPARLNRELPREIAAEARARNMGVYTQVSPFIVPDLLPDDQSVYPDGTVPEPPQVSRYGSPASLQVREFGKALALDTLDYFDSLDGLFLDWAEFGAYDLRDLFAGIDTHTEAAARSLGADWLRISSAVTATWDRLHALNDEDLRPAESALKNLIEESEGWSLWNKLKADIIVSYYREVRTAMNEAGHDAVKLIARGWPPPWNTMTGLAYEQLGDVCDSVSPKLFAFDYCALPRWYGQTLKTWNPALSETRILDAIVHWLDMVDDLEPRRFDNYHIPYVDETQPMGVDHYKKRVREVISMVSGRTPVQPFAHAHMPFEMWSDMVTMLNEQATDGYWIQMYAYLSDAKLDLLRDVHRSGDSGTD